MNRIRLRIWTNGAITATERTPTGAGKVLEFDGRNRYHAVTIHAGGWSETELMVHNPPGSKGRSLFLKHTAEKSHDQILTQWRALSVQGTPSWGDTLLQADNSVTWTQETKRAGFSTKAHGDGFSSTREVVNAAGSVTSRSTSSTTYGPADGNARPIQSQVVVHADGSTTTTTKEKETGKAGAAIQRTITIDNDPSGQPTGESTAVTSKNTDGSTSSHTVTVDYSGGTSTETSTYSNGSQSTTATTVTDAATGDSVSTTESSSTSKDAQGNTVTTSTISVSSSDGFSSSLTNVTSSDGRSGYTSQTTDTGGNTVVTQSVTDAAGNTSTTSAATDTNGNQVVTNTYTDGSGNGNQTTDTYAPDGTLISSQTGSVTSGSSGPSGGGSPGGNSDSGSGSSGSGGGGDSGGSGGDSGMSDPDDGTDEGPRSPTRRVSMGQGKTDLGFGDPGSGGNPGDPDIGGSDSGAEGVPRNTGIASYLKGYVEGADADGWGDATSENAPSRAQIDVVLSVPSSADDEGWGNFNDPRAITGLTQLLVVHAGRTADNKMASGVLRALAANGLINAQVQAIDLFGEAQSDG
jgi:antitoxin component YwqK of YwqJK toxin-antitoxin module